MRCLCPARAPRRGRWPPRTSSAGPARGSPRAFSWCRAGPRAWCARRRATRGACAPPRHHLARAHRLLTRPRPSPAAHRCACFPLPLLSLLAGQVCVFDTDGDRCPCTKSGDGCVCNEGHEHYKAVSAGGEFRDAQLQTMAMRRPPRTSSAGPARGSPRAFSWCRAGPGRGCGAPVPAPSRPRARAALAPPSPALTPLPSRPRPPRRLLQARRAVSAATAGAQGRGQGRGAQPKSHNSLSPLLLVPLPLSLQVP